MFGNGKKWEKPYGNPVGMGIGYKTGNGNGNGNRLHGNGREWECKKPFPVISRMDKEYQYKFLWRKLRNPFMQLSLSR